MIVKGYEVSDQQKEAALSFLSSMDVFRAMQLELALEKTGVPKDNGVVIRAADRIIQRLRKAGKVRIINSGPWWEKSDRFDGSL